MVVFVVCVDECVDVGEGGEGGGGGTPWGWR